MANSRLQAVKTLLAVVRDRQSLATQIPRFSSQLEAQDQGFYQELVYGVLRWQVQLDQVAKHYLSKPLKGKDRDIRILLWLGLYQLTYMQVPDHAAINETVALTRKLTKAWASGLINAVLRQYQRQRDQETALPYQSSQAYRFSHPEWLQQAIHNAWPNDYETILQGNNQRPPMTLRVNVQKTSRTAYLEALQEADIAATATALSSVGITLEVPQPVEKLPGFADGLVSVQDEAAQLAALLLDLQPGQRVLDACAAPGGKTCHILETEPALAHLAAVDSEASRLERVEQNLSRLQLEASVHCADASDLNAWWRSELAREFGIDSVLELEFETHYQRFLMPTIRGSDKGSKKRYAGMVAGETGPRMVFKGLENVRTDWTRLAREFQEELYRRIFLGEPHEEFVKDIAARVLAGQEDANLVYRKRLRRRLDDYERNVPPHVQAARKYEECSLPAPVRGDWVEYVITTAGAEPAAAQRAPLDYQHYIDRQLAPVADGILNFVGSSFAALTDQQMGLFE